MSPAKIWIGVTISAIHIAIENMIARRGCPVLRSRCQAPTAADHEGRRQVGRQHHVHEPVGEGRVEDDRPPVLGHELADLVDRVALRASASSC